MRVVVTECAINCTCTYISVCCCCLQLCRAITLLINCHGRFFVLLAIALLRLLVGMIYRNRFAATIMKITVHENSLTTSVSIRAYEMSTNDEIKHVSIILLLVFACLICLRSGYYILVQFKWIFSFDVNTYSIYCQLYSKMVFNVFVCAVCNNCCIVLFIC